MSNTKPQKRMLEVIKRLKKEYPEARTALNFENPYQLLLATILSARSTDKKVNQITPQLFRNFPDVYSLAEADINRVEEIIRPTGFFRQKSKFIVNAAKMIVRKFNGKVPDNMKDLTELPGVARKTANIVLANAFNKVEGIAVDTHVKRLTTRLGFTKNKNPDKIEKDLLKITPKKDWYSLNYLLIEHGRAVCKSRNPKCKSCILNDICPSAFSF